MAVVKTANNEPVHGVARVKIINNMNTTIVKCIGFQGNFNDIIIDNVNKLKVIAKPNLNSAVSESPIQDMEVQGDGLVTVKGNINKAMVNNLIIKGKVDSLRSACRELKLTETPDIQSMLNYYLGNTLDNIEGTKVRSKNIYIEGQLLGLKVDNTTSNTMLEVEVQGDINNLECNNLVCNKNIKACAANKVVRK